MQPAPGGLCREFGDRIVGLARGRVVFDDDAQALTDADIDRIYEQPAQAPAKAETNSATEATMSIVTSAVIAAKPAAR